MLPQSRELRAEGREGWVPATVVAELLGITRQAVLKRAVANDWEHRRAPLAGGGREMQIALSALPEAVQVRYLQSREPRAESRERDPEPPGSEYEQASPAERAEADARLTILQAWWAFLVQGGTREISQRTQEFVARWNAREELIGAGSRRGTLRRISHSTLYGWQAAYRARGLDGLLPRRDRDGRRRDPGRPPSVTTESEDGKLFQALWSGEANLKIAPAYRAFLIVRRDRGILGPPPTLGAIRYMMSTLSEVERDALRKGSKAYDAAHLPMMERDLDVAPFDWFCMDDRQWDVATISRTTGKMHFPYICAGEDLGTRRAVVTVGDRPCQDSTLATAGKAMSAWGGVFRNMYVDNGKNYTAKSVTGGKRKRFSRGLDEPRVRSLCDQLGITPHFALKFNARAKPVERLFATMAEHLDKILPGYRGRSTEHKPEGLKDELDPGKLLTDDDLERAITGWIESEYHQTMPHHGRGMNGRTPNQAWEEKIGDVTVRTPTRDQLKFWMMRAPKVRDRWPIVRRGRVIVMGRPFRPATENLDCLHAWEGREVICRYWPWDIRYVFATDLEDRPIGWLVEKALLGLGEVAGRRVDEARGLQRRARAVKRAFRDEILAERNEPDALKRVVREHYMAQAQLDERGRPVPTAPPGKPGARQIIPMPAGARASARIVAAGPPTRDAREHGAAAAAEQQEALDLILMGERPRAAILPAPAARKSEYDEALDLILEAKG